MRLQQRLANAQVIFYPDANHGSQFRYPDVIGGLMMSLGAQIAHDLVGSDNVLVNGVAIALTSVQIS
jgi:hypothetical protein